MTLTQAQREELVRIAAPSGFLRFLERWVRIEDQVKGAIPFEMWPAHQRAAEALQTEHLLVVLKARQVGMSWLFGAAYPLWLASFRPNTLCMLFSQREQESAELIRKCRFIWSRLPEWMKVPLEKDNAMALTFGGMGSRILAFPSSPDAGSGYTARYVLGDEYAKQEYARDQFNAIRPTIDMGGQFVALSSARGPSTFHAELWSGAVAGRNGFTPIFFPYNARPDRDEDWWYRTKDTYPQEWQFFQEYPREADEAIQSSEPRMFAGPHLQLLAGQLEPHPAATLASKDEDLLLLSRIKPKYGALGCRIYQLPVGGAEYVIGADVAEGQVGGDFQAAVCLDRVSGEEVAVLHGHWSIDDFAIYLDAMANAYRALLAPERNNHGHALIASLFRRQAARIKAKKRVTYELYHEKPILDAKGRVSRPGKPGWLTSPRTRPLLLSDLDTALRGEDIKLASQAVLEDLKAIVEDEKTGKQEAKSPFHDDLAFATAIAWQMVIRTPRPKPRPQQPYAMGQHPKDIMERFERRKQGGLIRQGRGPRARPTGKRIPFLQRLEQTRSHQGLYS